MVETEHETKVSFLRQDKSKVKLSCEAFPKEFKRYTREEVAKHNTKADAWIIVDGEVFDISDFVEQHPGGYDIVLGKLGRDITETLKNPKIHQHSQSAYSFLNGYKIGTLIDEKQDEKQASEEVQVGELPKSWGKVDFRKPIVHQAGMLGKDYAEWASTNPVHFKDPVILFHNPILEMTSHTKWYSVPISWLPIVFLCTIVGWKTSPLSLLGYSAVLTIGFFFWFFMEYYLHKYLFHSEWLATRGLYITNVVHFVLHGVHHKVPMDHDRLVVPFSFAAVFAIPLFLTIAQITSLAIALNFVPGTILGYIFYDLTHYSLHHASNPQDLPFPISWLFSTKVFQTLRTHHIIHHFAPQGHDSNFGISNQTIDILLSSLKKEHYKLQ